MIKIKTSVLGVLVVVLFFGGIGVSMLIGRWNVTSTKRPVLIRSGEFVGMPSPTDIRGSYSWDDVSAAFSIPVGQLLSAFNGRVGSEKVNSLETLYAGKVPEGMEIGTDSVRLFVSLFTGLPHEAEQGTVLPSTAISVLQQNSKTDSVRLAEVSARAVSVKITAGDEGGNTASSKKEALRQNSASISFTGKTTFKELKNAGFDMQKVELITGTPTSLESIIKDFVAAKGMEFSEVKTKLQEIAP